MGPSLDVALRRPVVRFGVLALVVGALGVAGLVIPFSSAHLPPPFRLLPEATQRLLVLVLSWMLLLTAGGLAAVAVRVASSASYRILVEGGRLEFPIRTGATKVVPLRDVVSIEPNAAGDHVVILTKERRYLLAWYVMPSGRSPRQVAEEIAAVAGAARARGR